MLQAPYSIPPGISPFPLHSLNLPTSRDNEPPAHHHHQQHQNHHHPQAMNERQQQNRPRAVVPLPTFLQHSDPRKLVQSAVAARTGQKISTVLTNVQRRNIQTTAPVQARSLTFHQMAAQGEMHMLLERLETKSVNVNMQDAQGFTPLLWACANGQKSAVELLVYSGADIHLTGDNGESALQLASCFGHQDIVEYLLKAGARINDSDELGNTALMFAALNNHVPVLVTLLEWGADLTLENEEGFSALAIAIKKGALSSQRVLESKITDLLGK